MSQEDPLPDDLPPHSIEAERGVLGCILVDPDKAADCMAMCIERLKVGSKVFFDLKHRTIYERMVDIYDDGRPVDVLMLKEELNDMLQLAGVGGIVYIASLPEATPSSGNLSHYLDILVEKYSIRTVIQASALLAAKVSGGGVKADAAIAEAEAMVQEAAAQFQNVTTVKKVSELVPYAEQAIEHLHLNKGVMLGIPTGFIDLDKMTRGLRAGEVFVLAGRPSSGKSAYGMNLAEHASIVAGVPVAIFSLEMTASSLMMRMMCSRAEVNMNRVLTGECTEEAFAKLALASGALNAAPLHIDDEAGISLIQLKAKARRMHKTLGIQMFVIDYLQLLHVTHRVGNRQEEVAALSKGIRQMAKDLQVAVVLLAQLNRDSERGGIRKPRLSDLRESGSIEQDADIVGILYSPKESPSGDDYNETSEFCKTVHLSICKSRNGPTGDIPLTFFKPYTRFKDGTK